MLEMMAEYRWTHRHYHLHLPDMGNMPKSLLESRHLYYLWKAIIGLIDNLVGNGMFYTGIADLTRCYQCGLGLKDWTREDDILFVHLKYSPTCYHIKRNADPNLLRIYQRHIDPPDGSNNGLTNTSSNGIDNPIRHPEYQSHHVGLASSSGWPSERTQTPEMLSMAGFFHLGVRAIVRCFACDGGLQNWYSGDEPWLEHAQLLPYCSYVLQVKGEAFIQLVQTAFEAQAKRKELEFEDGTNADIVYPFVWELSYSKKAVTLAVDKCKSKRRVDLCHCYLCGLGLKDWSINDDVLFVHLKYSPNCKHLTETVDSNILSVYRRNIQQTTGLRDILRCYACNSGLQRWDAGDQPWIEHARWFYIFEHVRREKYIRLVQAAAETPANEKITKQEIPLDSPFPIYSTAATNVMGLGYSQTAVSMAIHECKGNKTTSKKLLEENEKLKRLLMCTVCQQRERNIVFQPCSHLLMCIHCSDKVTKCPACSKTILYKLKIA